MNWVVLLEREDRREPHSERAQLDLVLVGDKAAAVKARLAYQEVLGAVLHHQEPHGHGLSLLHSMLAEGDLQRRQPIDDDRRPLLLELNLNRI